MNWVDIHFDRTDIATLVTIAAVAGSLFNALTHAGVACCFLFWHEKGRELWHRMVLGRSYEAPGVGIHYLLSVALPEAWASYRYLTGAPDATRRLFAYEIFALGGGGAYQHLVLSTPFSIDRHLQHMLGFEWLFVLGLVMSDDVSASWDESAKIYVGCKVAGFLWSAFVAGALRFLGVVRLARAPAAELIEMERKEA